MATLWKKDGKLIVDENKSPIICDECPCEQRYGYIMSRGEFHRPRLTFLNNYVMGAVDRNLVYGNFMARIYL